mmetsp:Transcript_38101/g.98768  ORF Transcript_38101/g.98768 Transcript_38101/m.98768 type:complete len:320 (+) Transcript_38101:226-1185(+)
MRQCEGGVYGALREPGPGGPERARHPSDFRVQGVRILLLGLLHLHDVLAVRDCGGPLPVHAHLHGRDLVFCAVQERLEARYSEWLAASRSHARPPLPHGVDCDGGLLGGDVAIIQDDRQCPREAARETEQRRRQCHCEVLCLRPHLLRALCEGDQQERLHGRRDALQHVLHRGLRVLQVDDGGNLVSLCSERRHVGPPSRGHRNGLGRWCRWNLLVDQDSSDVFGPRPGDVRPEPGGHLHSRGRHQRFGRVEFHDGLRHRLGHDLVLLRHRPAHAQHLVQLGQLCASGFAQAHGQALSSYSAKRVVQVRRRPLQDLIRL